MTIAQIGSTGSCPYKFFITGSKRSEAPLRSSLIVYAENL